MVGLGCILLEGPTALINGLEAVARERRMKGDSEVLS